MARVFLIGRVRLVKMDCFLRVYILIFQIGCFLGPCFSPLFLVTEKLRVFKMNIGHSDTAILDRSGLKPNLELQRKDRDSSSMDR